GPSAGSRSRSAGAKPSPARLAASGEASRPLTKAQRRPSGLARQLELLEREPRVDRLRLDDATEVTVELSQEGRGRLGDRDRGSAFGRGLLGEQRVDLVGVDLALHHQLASLRA